MQYKYLGTMAQMGKPLDWEQGWKLLRLLLEDRNNNSPSNKSYCSGIQTETSADKYTATIAKQDQDRTNLNKYW